MKILVIIPAYNEASFIEECLISLQNQDFPANEIIVVDDSSTDNTFALVSEFCNQHSTFACVRKETTYQKGHQPGAKIVEAFLFGLSQAKSDYDVVCKFDADLIFPSDYLAKMKSAFETNPKTGMFGGFCEVKKEGVWQVENLTGKEHLRGALKAYRKECYQSIGGLRPYMGWDTLDELLAYFYGWKLEIDETLLVKHLKPTGTKYRKELPKLYGVSCFQIGYDFGLCFFASLKMGLKRKSFGFVFKSCYYYLQAKSEGKEVLVNKEEQNFIRSYRWKKIKTRLMQ